MQASALYRHFPNKQTLLADLADRILARSLRPLDDDRGWEERSRIAAARLRDVLLAYRDGAEVVASTLALGLGSAEIVERLASSLTHDGFDGVTRRRAATTLLHFVLGHVAREQQRLQYDSIGVAANGAAPIDIEATME